MRADSEQGFLDRTLANLRAVWRGLAGAGDHGRLGELRPELPDADAERLRAQMKACLETRGGEVSARARAAAVGHAYLALDATGRRRFLALLAHEFDVDHAAVDRTAAALAQATEPEARRLAEDALRRALAAPRVELIRRFNALPQGVKFLVDLRAELRQTADGDAALIALESELKVLLTTWFDVDFLDLRRITWETASAALLEKLFAYEAVHAIESWADLKNRLESDRRCYAFFHPRMPDEPLIFLEVALVSGLADDIGVLLDETTPVLDPRRADTAIFYSISNAQKGLAGISFGGFLIKRVVDSLRAEFPGLKTFATLSPVPGFRPWLEHLLSQGEDALLATAEARALAQAMGQEGEQGATLAAALACPDWSQDEKLAEALRRPLMRLCARYLVREKGPGTRARDAVAHFHFANGARIARIDWLADRSIKGLAQSAGMMVNYVYRLDEIEANHEAYASEGEIAADSAVRTLAKG